MILTSNIWSNGFDNSIAIWFSQLFENMPHFLKDIFIAFSSLGDYGIFFILVGICFLFYKKTRKIGIYCFVGIILALLFNDVIFKNIFDRARPFEDPNLLPQLISITNHNGIVYGIAPSSSSFPSGHTFECFAVASLITIEYIFNKEERKFYLPFMIFFIVFAVIMGLTRVLLSHHYMSDVIAGMGLGIVIGILGYYLVKYTPTLYNLIKNKIKEKKENKENN